MNGFVEQNAISNRIEKLRTLWAEATKDKSKFVFRWYVKGDEARLIQGWYTLEGSEHGIFPELFLRFDSNMLRYEEYASNLVAELTEKFEVDKEECAAAGINISFVPNPESNSNKRSLLPLYFSDNLEKFADALPDFKENVYVLLYPGDLQNTATAYKQWIFDLVENSTFKRLKLVLLDTDEFPMFEQVTKSFPKICTTLQPDLKMDEAMRQMASAGNPAAPEVQFRKLFVQISQAAAEKKYDEMERLAGQAMHIAELAGWTHMKIAILFTVASAYFSANKTNDCLTRYNEALKIAEDAIDKGDQDIAPILLIQCHAFLGSVYVQAKNYPLACEHYKIQAEKALERKDFFSAMEAFRLKGYCEQQSKIFPQAWESYRQSIDSARNMDEAIRKNSTLPFVGQALYELAEKLAKPQPERVRIGEEMTELVGNDWQEKLITAKSHS